MLSTYHPKKEVNTTSEAKQTKVFGNKDPLRTDKSKNIGETKRKMIVRTPRKNWKVYHIQTKNTNSEAKQTSVWGNKEPLKTGKTENVDDNTKEDDSEKSKEKLKDISNTDKETYE